MANIFAEEKVKLLKTSLKNGGHLNQSEVNFLFNHIAHLTKALNKICSNYYCRFDTLDDKDSPYTIHDVECPTCLANTALVKKVKE